MKTKMKQKKANKTTKEKKKRKTTMKNTKTKTKKTPASQTFANRPEKRRTITRSLPDSCIFESYPYLVLLQCA